MTINEYQKEALRDSIRHEQGISPDPERECWGLGGESGECLDIVKKHPVPKGMSWIRNIWPRNWETWRGIWR